MPIDDDGLLDLDALDAALARGPKLVAVAHVSNVLGTVNPIAEIARRAHDAGAIVVVDGTQAAPHMPVDVGALDADFYAWTGHKAYGPTGIGVLHGRRALLEEMPPFLGGGHMIARVTEEGFTSAEPPAKFEAGHDAGRRGDRPRRRRRLPVRHRHGRGLGALARRRRLRRRAAARGARAHALRAVDVEHRGSVAAFAIDGVHPHDVAEILGREGVCVRAGHHCAQPLMRRLGVSATTRASFAVHSTREEVDRLIDGLGTVREVFAVMDDLYRENILQHYKNPHHWGELADADLEADDLNPLCGDELKVQLKVDGDGKIEDVRFSGHGCAISQASASMTSDEIIGMPVEDLLKLDRDVRARPAGDRHLRHAHEVRAAVAEGAQERLARPRRAWETETPPNAEEAA